MSTDSGSEARKASVNAVSEVVRRLRPTALIIAMTLALLAGFIIWQDVSYAETIVGVIVGALAGGFDKLAKDSDDDKKDTQ